jgi:putative endonuclease
MGCRRHPIILPRTGQISAVTLATGPRILVYVSTDSRLQRGAASEQLAAEYLQARGLLVLARNLRCRAGELDLVCLDRDVLAIVEVRQRSRIDFGGALASITWRKQRKIVRAAQFFLQRQAAWRGHVMRFDVLALEGPPDGAHRIVWIKDAFCAT